MDPETVARILKNKALTVAVAESCTGGCLSNLLTNVSGSSEYFLLGVIAYSNASKVNILGVKEASLRRFGAVSGKVALEMAGGIKLLSGADIGIGITGIAGPTGGTKVRPIGLVYIALVAGNKKVSRRFNFKGSRQAIKSQASQAALTLLRNICASLSQSN